jgi:ADP-ribosylglycohydrolase
MPFENSPGAFERGGTGAAPLTALAPPLGELEKSLAGCLLGTAVGDSVGLPFENLSRRSVARIAPQPLEQSLVAGKGLVSDDTEHTVMVALSVAEAGADVELFRRRLAARLRWWLSSAPPGVGSATARAILKLWMGWPPASSGVHSAGNGPAMRAALLGVAFGHEPALLVQMVQACTCVTHTDRQAFEAALAVAVAAACAARLGPCTAPEAMSAFARTYTQAAGDATALREPLRLLRAAVDEQLSVAAFAERLGCGKGVTGYALHTVPAALYAWMRHTGDLRAAVTAIVHCGGDTDSTAAIVGGIVGAGLGPQGVPGPWLARLLAWPRGPVWMGGVAQQVAAAVHRREPAAPTAAAKLRELAGWPGWLLRNLAMFVVVVVVAFKRLAAVALARDPRPGSG